MTKLISFSNRSSTAFFSQGKNNISSFLFTAKFVVLCCAFCKLWRNFGFFYSVSHLSGGDSGGGLMQITMQHARPAWTPKTKLTMTLDCSRIGKEIAMVSGSFVERRMQTLLYSCEWQKSERSEKSSKQTGRLLPEIDDHKQLSYKWNSSASRKPNNFQLSFKRQNLFIDSWRNSPISKALLNVSYRKTKFHGRKFSLILPLIINKKSAWKIKILYCTKRKRVYTCRLSSLDNSEPLTCMTGTQPGRWSMHQETCWVSFFQCCHWTFH